MSSSIYLDYNATTPVRPEVAEAMQPYWSDCFGNPSSSHQFGQRAQEALEGARAQVARLFGAARPSEVVFTAGGAEANVLGIRGFLEALPSKSRILASPIEHDAVMALLAQLGQQDYGVDWLSVDSYARVNPAEVQEKIRSDTALIVVMQANNEVGTIQPIGEIAQIAARAGVALHVDAVQAAGKLPIAALSWGAASVAVSGHKFGAPKGIGALWIRSGHRLRALVPGHQEGGRRSGTQNVAFAVGIGIAGDLAVKGLADYTARLAPLRDRFEEAVKRAIADISVNGHPTERTANTSHISFAGIKGENLAIALDMEGIAVSTGSACSSGSSTPRHVLAAMALAPQWREGAIRFSLGYGTTQADLDRTVEVLGRLAGRLRKIKTPA